jgi:hypothetical protein
MRQIGAGSPTCYFTGTTPICLRRRGEMPSSGLALTLTPTDDAEAEMAVRHERAHDAGLGQCQRLPIGRLARLGVEPVAPQDDITE